MGHVSCIGKMINANKILAGRHVGKRPLRRSRLRGDDINIIGLELMCVGVDRIQVAED
jgi:hypothetical protein